MEWNADIGIKVYHRCEALGEDLELNDGPEYLHIQGKFTEFINKYFTSKLVLYVSQSN